MSNPQFVKIGEFEGRPIIARARDLPLGYVPEVPLVGGGGPKGDKGDKGDPGDPGADGADGADGTNGTNGADGTSGPSLNTIIDTLYPVGALYTSTLTTNPATLLGRGTWAAFGAGKVLVGRDANDTDFDVAEETGGAKTKAISAHAGATVADHAAQAHSAHSGSAVGTSGAGSAHTHTQGAVTQPTIAWPAGVPTASGSAVGTSGAGSAHTHTQGAVTQPTIAWPAGVPTAATESAHTHTSASTPASPKLVTGNVSTGVGVLTGGGTAHGHTLSWPAGVPTATLTAVANPANESAHTHAAGTITQPTIAWPAGVPVATGAAVANPANESAHTHAAGSVTQPSAHTDHAALAHSVGQASAHTDLNVVQPYIVVYMWKRTA